MGGGEDRACRYQQSARQIGPCTIVLAEMGKSGKRTSTRLGTSLGMASAWWAENGGANEQYRKRESDAGPREASCCLTRREMGQSSGFY